jgi:hypothetical protein
MILTTYNVTSLKHFYQIDFIFIKLLT